jgi:hypothetical protein
LPLLEPQSALTTACAFPSTSCIQALTALTESVQRYCRSAAGARRSAATEAPRPLQRRG